MGFNLSINDFKSFGRLACLSTIFVLVQFLVLTTIAALFYPGGYDYLGYYFSDLGAIIARNGTSNGFSSALFTFSLILIGIFMIPIWLILPSLFKGSSFQKITSYIGTCFGLLASPLIIGTGIFPMDTESELHGLFARYFFLAFGVAILVYSITILLNKDYSNYYAVFGFLIFILVLIYIYVSLGDLRTLVQKIVVYSYIVWGSLQVIRIWPFVEPS